MNNEEALKIVKWAEGLSKYSMLNVLGIVNKFNNVYAQTGDVHKSQRTVEHELIKLSGGYTDEEKDDCDWM